MKQTNTITGTVSDVAELFSRLPSDTHQYHELQRSQGANSAATRWPLLHEVRSAGNGRPGQERFGQ